MSHNSRYVLVVQLDFVAGGVGLQLTDADGVVGDSQAVAPFVQVDGGGTVQGHPVVMPTHPVREDALFVVVVNYKIKKL